MYCANNEALSVVYRSIIYIVYPFLLYYAVQCVCEFVHCQKYASKSVCIPSDPLYSVHVFLYIFGTTSMELKNNEVSFAFRTYISFLSTPHNAVLCCAVPCTSSFSSYSY